MKNLRKSAFTGLAVVIAMNASATWAHCGACGSGDAHKSADIVDTAAAAGNFKTLIAAAKAAGLVETLKSDGPLTVFAPTDDAFAKLPDGTVEKLLGDPERLGAILKYHVIAGKVLAADVVKLKDAKTVLGQSLAIDTSDGVKVGTANVVATDVKASNGVIHVIDSVLIPNNDIVEVARSAGSFKTLLTALEAADLTGALQTAGPFTVFAPTDDAFAKLPKGTVESLLKDKEKLKAILTYHVVSGEVLAKDVVKLGEARTLQGQTVKIDTSNGVKVDKANVVKTDVKATNGVIHVVDSVLLPSDAGQANAAKSNRELIQRAVEHGARLYNDGHHAACAAVYEVAAMGLLNAADQSIAQHEKIRLKSALASIAQSRDSSKNAWIMRHALDEAYETFSYGMNQ